MAKKFKTTLDMLKHRRWLRQKADVGKHDKYLGFTSQTDETDYNEEERVFNILKSLGEKPHRSRTKYDVNMNCTGTVYEWTARQLELVKRVDTGELIINGNTINQIHI